MTKRLNWAIVIVLLVIGLPYYWLMLDNRPGNMAVQPLTMSQLRSLASSLPGAAPSGIEMEQIALRDTPSNLFAAGSGLHKVSMAIMAFRLPVSGGKPIVIDSGFVRANAEAMGITTWRADRQAAVDRAMDEAGLVLFTHEHPDHIGGMMAWAKSRHAANPQTLAKVRMNTAQFNFANAALHLPPTELPPPQAAYAPFALAPGVVVIPAPSHTPGSQMIYVRLANGREYLFTGDIATLDISWRQLRARSHLIGTFFAPEDRGAVYAWLKTVKALKAANHGLFIVPGHDAGAILATEAHSGIREGFDLSQINAAVH